MNTEQFAAMLSALANLAEERTSEELLKLSEFFRSGKMETIAARLKNSGTATGHPTALKEALQALQGVMAAAGAAKQARAAETVLQIFQGAGGVGIDRFIEEISTPPAKQQKSTGKTKEPDVRLARELADNLLSSLYDAEEFDGVLAELKATKKVNTPTLWMVANIFLGNSTKYRSRKESIDDIVRRRNADLREDARGRALARVGV